jgi:Domain of unknown function (DUF397)
MTMALDLSRAQWRKSSYSNGQGGDCVEVARNLPGTVVVRDSTDRTGPVLAFTTAEWRVLLSSVRTGRAATR